MPRNRLELETDTFKHGLDWPTSISRFDGKVVALGDVIAAHRRDLIDTFELKPIIGPLEVYPLVDELNQAEIRKVFGGDIARPVFGVMEAHENPLVGLVRPWVRWLSGDYKADVIEGRKNSMRYMQSILIKGHLQGQPVKILKSTK